MCGIAGVTAINETGFLSPYFGRQVASMIASLHHRGPDEKRVLVFPGGAIGAARLRVRGGDKASQPVSLRNSSLVFNGEIYNMSELAECLGVRKKGSVAMTEVELLVRLFEEFGPSAISKINFEGAIAWFSGERKSIFLFRDRFGIRPLFYCLGLNQFAFSSEVKSLLSGGVCQPRLDANSLASSYLNWGLEPTTTSFEGICQVAPGGWVSYKPETQRLETGSYWRLESDFETGPPSDPHEFEIRLDQAVRNRLEADVPLGSYVSGGIDSSCILASACRSMDADRIRTFSVTFDDPEFDESIFQEMLVHRFGTTSSKVVITKGDQSAAFEDVVYATEAPIFRSAPIPMFLLARSVRQAGTVVILSGEGADEMLLGYDIFKEAKLRKRWSRNLSEKSNEYLFGRLYGHLPQFSNRRFRSLSIDYFRQSLPIDETNPHWFLDTRRALTFGMRDLMVDRFQYSIDDTNRFLNGNCGQSLETESLLRRIQAHEIKYLLHGYLLSSQGDRVSMASSIETRHPYLDCDFVKYVSNLPRSSLLSGMKDKKILRASYAELPKQLRNRPKVAYQSPDIDLFFDDDGIRQQFKKFVAPEMLEEIGIFNVDAVTGFVARLSNHRSARFGSRDSIAMMNVFSTSVLFDLFVKRRVFEELPVCKVEIEHLR